MGSSREQKLIISRNAKNQIRNRKGTHLSHFAGAVPRNQDYQQKALEAENHLVGRMGKGRMTRESDNLRGTEREFTELVLEAEWIKSREIRGKMVTDAHNTLHQGPMGTFWKLLHDGYFWSDMKRDCRRASQKCKQCLRHNVRE